LYYRGSTPLTRLSFGTLSLKPCRPLSNSQQWQTTIRWYGLRDRREEIGPQFYCAGGRARLSEMRTILPRSIPSTLPARNVPPVHRRQLGRLKDERRSGSYDLVRRAAPPTRGSCLNCSPGRCPRCHELTVLGPDGGGIDEELKPSVMLRNAVRRYTALKCYPLPAR
jgi:hypothetical protein